MRLLAGLYPLRRIARWAGVSFTAARSAVRGATWAHLEVAPYVGGPPSGPRQPGGSLGGSNAGPLRERRTLRIRENHSAKRVSALRPELRSAGS